jgi:hypothetical protein
MIPPANGSSPQRGDSGTGYFHDDKPEHDKPEPTDV